jgi:hypothetical protein
MSKNEHLDPIRKSIHDYVGDDPMPGTIEVDLSIGAKVFATREIGELVHRWENHEGFTRDIEIRLTAALIESCSVLPEDLCDLEASELFQDIMRDAAEVEDGARSTNGESK